jgi:hypothetical protein
LSLSAYDDAGLLYGSDARGTHPFFPRVNNATFKTIQVPTTLPTLDELLGRPEYPSERIIPHYLSLLRPGSPNILTIHAELEGMKNIEYFRAFLQTLKEQHIDVIRLDDLVLDLLTKPSAIPVCDLAPGSVDGRSGTLAVQKCV